MNPQIVTTYLNFNYKKPCVCNRVVPILILVSEIPPIAQKNYGIGIGESLNLRSDPIPCSYTRPIVMPVSFA